MASGDWFAQAFGELVADLRHKVVEEPWFGRAVTPSTEPQRQGFAEALGWAHRGSEPHQAQADPNTRDAGIDR